MVLVMVADTPPLSKKFWLEGEDREVSGTCERVPDQFPILWLLRHQWWRIFAFGGCRVCGSESYAY